MKPSLLPLLALAALSHAQDDFMGPRAVHFTLERRGGAFAPNRTADLDWLLEQLHIAEARFNSTQREVRGNKVVRAPKSRAVGGGSGENLIGEIGSWGSWFTKLRIGASRQPVETDIDMLTADFAVRSASSKTGTKFDEFFSSTYSVDMLKHPFSNCLYPTDQILVPTTGIPIMLDFPHCKPPHQSRDILRPSGAIWGLAPSPSLQQMDGVTSLMQQLLDSNVIDHEIFSVTLLNGYEGILSLGGTVAESIAMIEDRIERFLGKTPDTAHIPDDFGAGLMKRDVPAGPEEKHHAMKRDLAERVDPVFPPRGRPGRAEQHALPTWRDAWKWSPVEGAAGWWQTLMRGVWVDQAKVLKNQPVVVDLSTPFILAPPLAAKAFYASISGSRRLPKPYNNFYAFPCNNPPFLHLEFGGWRFPVMRGSKSMTGGGPDGKFSLGKQEESSGYCVGAVVETRMGVGDQSPVKRQPSRKDDFRGVVGLESGMLAGNGMRDVWVLGEPAFRGLGIVFDMKNREIGFRTY